MPQPQCNDQVEAWLQRRGVEYRALVNIPLSMFDERRSRANQARATALDPEVVDRYAAAYKNGDLFPPLVVYLASATGRKFVIIDGNHREAGARKAGVTQLPAYVVDRETSSEMITLLTVEANARHGLPTDTKWRIEQGLHLMDIGITQALASEATGLRPSALSQALQVRRADDRVRRLNVKGWADLAPTVRYVLSHIPDDAVLQAAARTAIDNQLTTDEVRRMQRDIKAQSSEAERLAVIGAVNQSKVMERAVTKAVASRSRRLSSPKMALTSGIGKILNFELSQVGAVFQTPFERAEIGRRIDEALEHLLAINDTLAELARADQEEAHAV